MTATSWNEIYMMLAEVRELKRENKQLKALQVTDLSRLEKMQRVVEAAEEVCRFYCYPRVFIDLKDALMELEGGGE